MPLIIGMVVAAIIGIGTLGTVITLAILGTPDPPEVATVVPAVPETSSAPEPAPSPPTTPAPTPTVATPIITTITDALTPEPEVWLPAGELIRIDDVTVRIDKVTIGNVPLWRTIHEDETESVEKLLTIWVTVTNTTARKKINYNGWMSRRSNFLDIDAALEDDVENRYRPSSFGVTTEVLGTTSSASLYPGKSLKDAIVFELPVGGAEYLHLTLDRAAWGETEVRALRIKIPAQMIVRE